MAPFGEPRWHQNGAKNDQNPRAKFKSEKVASQELLGAVFARFPCAVILQNRSPAKGKHTFLINHMFDIQLRQDAAFDRFSLPTWLQNAPFLASETVQKATRFFDPFLDAIQAAQPQPRQPRAKQLRSPQRSFTMYLSKQGISTA